MQKVKERFNGFQGDVIFIEIDKLPKDAKKIKGENAHVLQYGTATGHKHQLTSGEFIVYEILDTNQKFVKTKSECELTHEEHHKAVWPAGKIFEIRIAQEYDYDLEESKNIED